MLRPGCFALEASGEAVGGPLAVGLSRNSGQGLGHRQGVLPGSGLGASS